MLPGADPAFSVQVSKRTYLTSGPRRDPEEASTLTTLVVSIIDRELVVTSQQGPLATEPNIDRELVLFVDEDAILIRNGAEGVVLTRASIDGVGLGPAKWEDPLDPQCKWRIGDTSAEPSLRLSPFAARVGVAGSCNAGERYVFHSVEMTTGGDPRDVVALAMEGNPNRWAKTWALGADGSAMAASNGLVVLAGETDHTVIEIGERKSDSVREITPSLDGWILATEPGQGKDLGSMFFTTLRPDGSLVATSAPTVPPNAWVVDAEGLWLAKLSTTGDPGLSPLDEGSPPCGRVTLCATLLDPQLQPIHDSCIPSLGAHVLGWPDEASATTPEGREIEACVSPGYE